MVCCAFKLGFLQLICKASLIFKSDLELALSIILKQRELYESHIFKHLRSSEACFDSYNSPSNELPLDQVALPRTRPGRSSEKIR